MSDRNIAYFHWIFSWIYYIFPYAKPTYLEGGPATTQLQYVQSSVVYYSLPSSQLILLFAFLFGCFVLVCFFLVLRALGEYSCVRKWFVKLILKNTKAGWNKKIIFLRALSSRGSFFFFLFFSFLFSDKLYTVFNVFDDDSTCWTYHEGILSVKVTRKGPVISTLEADWLELTTFYYKQGLSLTDSFVHWEASKGEHYPAISGSFYLFMWIYLFCKK